MVIKSPGLKPIDDQKARSSSSGFVVDAGNQETEIEFLRATIYLHEVEPRIQP
jgi:hypothetical protein